MKTAFDMITYLFNIISVSELQDEISGNVYKARRPAGSTKEDVVITALPVLSGQLQLGVGNVNIHVPNLTIKIGGVTDTSQPDTDRMDYLTNLAIDYLQDNTDELNINSHRCFIANTALILDTDGSYYVNIKMNYESINLN